MRLHVLGLAHTETTRAFEFCAFTSRTRTFATMMTRLGYDVRLYAGAANEAEVTEHVALTDPDEQGRWFPDYDRTQPFNDFDEHSIPWRLFNQRAAAAIRERLEPGDIVCVTMGTTHRPIVAGLPADLLAVETGIGYAGVWAPYRVFESNAWRHYLAAKEPTDDVRWFDAVIPRAWEADDFPLGQGGGYLLFVGRLMARKGPHIAAQAAARIGAKLLVAGQGAAKAEPGRITCTDGTLLEGDVEYVGVVGPEERAKLMGAAIATFTPTMYLEPGGGVAIESMLTGTPVIASNWGCFTETVRHGETGYLCSTLDDFARAAMAVGDLDRAAIRDYALSSFSTDAVGPQYAHYFRRLSTLWGEGWAA